MKKVTVFFVTYLLFGTMSLGCTELQANRQTGKFISPWSVVWRSVMVPGWGQCYISKQLAASGERSKSIMLRDKGEFLFFSETVLVMGTVLTGFATEVAVNKYRAQVWQSEIDKTYKEANTYHWVNIGLTFGVVGLHLYNLVDACFIGRGDGKRGKVDGNQPREKGKQEMGNGKNVPATKTPFDQNLPEFNIVTNKGAVQLKFTHRF